MYPTNQDYNKASETHTKKVGPQGVRPGPNLNMHNRPWCQLNVTVNRSLWYLVTEEIEEQTFVNGQTDGQTAGRRTKGYNISSTGLRPSL